MLPVDKIRAVFTEVGATEDQIVTAIENYLNMRTTDRKEYRKSLDITFESQKMLKVLEDTMDVHYDEDGVPTGVSFKNPPTEQKDE